MKSYQSRLPRPRRATDPTAFALGMATATGLLLALAVATATWRALDPDPAAIQQETTE